MTGRRTDSIIDQVPQSTVDWLAEPSNPAVSVLFRSALLGESPDSPELSALWARRNDYAPVRRILETMGPDDAWADPGRDYQKYRGSLWQIIFLGELWADPSDARVRRAAEYSFSRQRERGSWGTGVLESAQVACLTANVGRSLARLGLSEDERVLRALSWLVKRYEELGYIGCSFVGETTLNGYCHMCTPKYLLFLAEVPERAWPVGADRIRGASIRALRDKQVVQCLPKQTRQFQETVLAMPRSKHAEGRAAFIAEHGPLDYQDKPGWLRFGFPLHYNSDTLEALVALAAVGEPMRTEYERALEVVRSAADDQMRWTMKNSLNGKMIADVEVKGQPSKWLTLRALTVLSHFGD